ncbi:hypothetical protein ACTU45_33255 [Streptomyces sp. 24-1644]|uniref:hypothetical protein n=1 Tax=Streptomyces sp. 24-1644 TaxID=3457315 RepID=UPI003FA7C410
MCFHYVTLRVLDGAVPYVIQPRWMRALRFEAGGHVVLGAEVQPQGPRAHGFLERALRASLRGRDTISGQIRQSLTLL